MFKEFINEKFAGCIQLHLIIAQKCTMKTEKYNHPNLQSSYFDKHPLLIGI